MRITRFKIRNYKGFNDSGWLSFGPGFNVIVGQNNTGKTALLECLRLGGCESRPHKSTYFARGATLDPVSWYEMEIQITGSELKQLALWAGTEDWVPVEVGERQQHQEFIDTLFSERSLTLGFAMRHAGQPVPSRYPSHGCFVPHSNQPHLAVRLLVTPDRQGIVAGQTAATETDTFLNIFGRGYDHLIYVFRPERLNLGTCPVENTEFLKPDASNLPAVLFKLQGNPARFERFNEHVRTIFPSITRVTVAPSEQQASLISIRIWSVDPATEREDLAIRLEESGTGVGQALSILYVAMTRTANVIAIDEPNAFLHPGAAKKLLSILKHYNQNQYIFSTHSSDLISIADPEALHLVSWNSNIGQTLVDQLDRSSIEHLNKVLGDVGASLSDVFGADRVIWVEGPTEKLCFPLILSRHSDGVPPGLVFAALRNTGDLESRSAEAEAVWEVYERLTQGPSLLPVVIAFSFDTEGRTARQIEDMQRRSNGRAHFLPRATYENYLLHAGAITSVLLEEFSVHELNCNLTVEAVQNWLDTNHERYVRHQNDARNQAWHVHCDAPKLLSDAFQELSETRFTYRKLTHSVALTKWILQNDPEALTELSEYVAQLAH